MALGVLDPLHVRAEIDEAEIPRFRPGASATVSSAGGSGGNSITTSHPFAEESLVQQPVTRVEP